MKIRLLAFIVSLLVFSSTGQASPTTFYFSATDFYDGADPPRNFSPYSAISGSFTIDSGALTSIDLTIGSHSYSVLDTVYEGDADFAQLAGKVSDDDCGFDCLMLNGDFMLWFYQSGGKPKLDYFEYTAAGFDGSFAAATTYMSLTPLSVPLPNTLILLLSGVFGPAFIRRFSRA